MMTTATYTSIVGLLAVTVMQVAAIGPCNNTLIQEIMTANAANCPTGLLDKMYKEGPQVQFRVMSQTFADMFGCATGVLDKPNNNVAILYNKFTFNNESLGSAYVNYTMVEANCGFLYKYITEETYVGFKIAYAYADGISFGYYGCTDEETQFSDDNDMYSMCYALSVDSAEVEASLVKCKAHMEMVTGDKDLVIVPTCDNDNEFLDVVQQTKRNVGGQKYNRLTRLRSLE